MLEKQSTYTGSKIEVGLESKVGEVVIKEIDSSGNDVPEATLLLQFVFPVRYLYVPLCSGKRQSPGHVTL